MRWQPFKYLLMAAGGGVLAAGVVILYWFDPSKVSFFPPCISYQLTHLYCPGCGATRAMHHLLHGHLVQAFRHNPLLLLAMPYLVWGLVRQWREMCGTPPPPRYAPAYVIWLVLVLIVTYTVVRNIPYGPFVYLAPPA